MQRAPVQVITDQTGIGTDGSSDWVSLPVGGAHIFVLEVSAAGADGSDTMDVTIEGTMPGFGDTQQIELVHFTQITGAMTTKLIATVCPPGAAAAQYQETANPAAGNGDELVMPLVRAVWDVTSGTAADFDFKVSVMGW